MAEGSVTVDAAGHAERAVVAQRIAQDLTGRIAVMLDLGLGYLSLERSTPSLSPGELQRLRLATQVRILPDADEAKGVIEIEYYNESDLERLLEVLGVLS